MNSILVPTLDGIRAAVSAVGGLPTDAASFSRMSEADLLEANRLYAIAHIALRGTGALIAGEIAHRSAPEFGSQGLAQRAGHRTPEQFVRITTGATSRDAVTAVRVGTLIREAATEGTVDPATGEVANASQPWLAPVTDALAERAISVEAAEAIRAGLGAPNSAISEAQLTCAAVQLCEVARTLDPDAVGRSARAFRDELDIEGVAVREEERRQKRSLRLFLQPDGTTKLVWIIDPETAATVRDLYDRSTSPKRGGVRFVDKQRQAAADSILRDERTADQIAADSFEQLLRLGAGADPRFLLGSGAPVIRLIAQVIFDSQGAVLDFGREQRFFTKKQKDALALTWGGCAAPGCDRPPSWCEAHHIVIWARDAGKTDLADGILLCRHHHLLFHNNGWEITRDARSRYWLIPPRTVIPPPTVNPPLTVNASQRPIEQVSKSAALRDLWRERAAS